MSITPARATVSGTETPFFLRRGSADLFAILHQPAVTAGVPFVFSHPFGEEKLWAHRVFVTFARELASRGRPVLRVDQMGHGDSDGHFSESSLGTAAEDLRAAMDEVKRRTGSPRVSVLGLRLGASLACELAAERTDIDELVLWAPIVNGARYLQELLRINLTTQMAVYREIRQDREQLGAILTAGGTVNVDGYEISRDLRDGLDRLMLLRDRQAGARRSLVVQIERSAAAKPSAELDQLRASLPSPTLTVVEEEPFWKEIQTFYDRAPNLFAATLAWLERT